MTKRKTNKGIAFDGIRRARQTDMVPDHAEPEKSDDGMSTATVPADSSLEPTNPEVHTVSGADLDAIL